MVLGDPAAQASARFAYPDGTTGSVSGAILFGVYLVGRGDLGGVIAMLVKVYAVAAIGSLWWRWRSLTWR